MKENNANYFAGFAEGYCGGIEKNLIQNNLICKEFTTYDEISFFEGYNRGIADICGLLSRLIKGNENITQNEMVDWLTEKEKDLEFARDEDEYDEPYVAPTHPPIIIFTHILDRIEALKDELYNKAEELADSGENDELADDLLDFVEAFDEIEMLIVKEDVEKHYIMREEHKERE